MNPAHRVLCGQCHRLLLFLSLFHLFIPSPSAHATLSLSPRGHEMKDSYHRNLEDNGMLPHVNFTALPTKNTLRINAWITTSLGHRSEIVLGCLAVQDGQRSNPPSINYMRVKSIRRLIPMNSSTEITLGQLEADLEYGIYCLTFDYFDRVTSSFDQMVARSITIRTLCCREIIISLQSTIISSLKSNLDLIGIMWKDNVVRDSNVTIEFLTDYQPFDTVSSNTTTSIPFYPLHLNLHSSYSGFTLSLPSHTPSGLYKLAFQIFGIDSASYQIIYETSNSFVVLSQIQDLNYSAVISHRVTPYLQECRYSSLHQHLILKFNSSTNMAPVGLLNARFNCSLLLTDNDKLSSHYCIWSRSDRLYLHPFTHHPELHFPIGSTLFISQDTLKSYSSLSFQFLSLNETVIEFLFPSSPKHSCQILGPNVPIPPRISISSPSLIGPYDHFTLDLTRSTGNLNHPWLNSTIAVYSSPHQSFLEPINRFFETNYSLSSPTSLSSDHFISQVTYVFEISLCNFLHLCSSHRFELFVSPHPVPVITLFSPRYLVNHNPQQPLVLESQIYQRNNSNLTLLSHSLNIVWTVRKDQTNTSNGEVISSLQSESMIPTIFKLAPGKLQCDTIYEIIVTALDPRTLLSSTNSIFISVDPPKLIPKIRGSPSHFSLSANQTRILNASLSFDENLIGMPNPSAGIHFHWHCSLVDPIVGDPFDCGITFSSSSTPVVLINASYRRSSTLCNYTSRITLSLSSYSHDESSLGIRQSFLSFLVDVVFPNQSLGAVMVSSSPFQYITHQKVSIDGHSHSTSEIMSELQWHILPHPENSNLSALKTNMNSYYLFFPLILRQFSLVPMNSYLLTLSLSSGSFFSLYVPISANPTPGILTISPQLGFEFTTLFHFSTHLWSSSNDDLHDYLPIFYEFGFLSPHNSDSILAIQHKSFRSSLISYLPRGSNSGDFLHDPHELICFVKGSNGNGAISYLTYPITVLSMELNSLDYHSLIMKETTATTLGKNPELASNWILSTGVTSLNQINRSCPLIDCAKLNRFSCHTSMRISHTCGKCFPGYLADDFLIESNTPCYESQTLSSALSIKCSSSIPCPYSYICDESKGSCVVSSQKRCPNDCSSRGKCLYFSRITREQISECHLLDSNCEPQCICQPDYYSTDCSLSQSESQLKISSRKLLLSQLSQEFSENENIQDRLTTYLTLLRELYRFQDELDSFSCSSLLLIVWDFFHEISKDPNIPYDDFVELSVLFDVCYQILPSEIFDTFLQYLEILAEHMLPLEQAIEIIESKFRVVIDWQQPVTTSSIDTLVYRIPQTPLEKLVSYNQIVVSFSPASVSYFSASSPPSIIISQTSLLPNSITKEYLLSGTFVSNPIRIRIRKSSNLPRKLLINFTRISTPLVVDSDVASTVSTVSTEKESFTTRCLKHKIETTLHICKNKYRIRHYCDGVFNGLFTTQCPDRNILPICAVMSRNILASANWTLEENNQCQVFSFDHDTLSCQCHLPLDFNSFEVIPYESYVFSSSSTTTLDLPGENLDSVIVVMLFMFLWLTILAIGFLCHYVDSPPKLYSVNNVSTNTHSAPNNAPSSLQQRRRGRKSCPSGSLAAYAYVLKYIDKTIPFVFRPKKSLTKHLSFAIFQNHRYLRIFTSGGRSHIRIIQMFHFLTVQSFVLFILWLILDRQVIRASSALSSLLLPHPR